MCCAAEASAVDASLLRRPRGEGRATLAAGDTRSARAAFESALTLWRGPVLADFAYESFTVADTARLDEVRASSQEDYVDALLACGDDGWPSPSSNVSSPRNPARTPARAADAGALPVGPRRPMRSAAYEQVRRDLADGLGIDPSPALDQLHHRILDQEAGLTLPEPEPVARAPRPRSCRSPTRRPPAETAAPVRRARRRARRPRRRARPQRRRAMPGGRDHR